MVKCYTKIAVTIDNRLESHADVAWEYREA